MLAPNATLLTIRNLVTVDHLWQVLERVRNCKQAMGYARIRIEVNDPSSIYPTQTVQ